MAQTEALKSNRIGGACRLGQTGAGHCWKLKDNRKSLEDRMHHSMGTHGREPEETPELAMGS